MQKIPFNVRRIITAIPLSLLVISVVNRYMIHIYEDGGSVSIIVASILLAISLILFGPTPEEIQNYRSKKDR